MDVIDDSYKLLNGKYPATTHREQRIKNKIALATMVLYRPIFVNKYESLNNDKLTQYVIIVNNKTPKTIFDEKF